MNPFAALVREVRIVYYRWAVRDLRYTRHVDQPLVIVHLNDLIRSRGGVR